MGMPMGMAMGMPMGMSMGMPIGMPMGCLLYPSDAADDLLCVDLGGRRIIKKKNMPQLSFSSLPRVSS